MNITTMPSETKAKIKKKLLRVALNIFAEKGYVDTSIAEIAKTAGVRETIIYELFSGKEDLLFNIPVEKTQILIESLQEHLKGIVGAENKLRKIIWHFLNFQEINKDYATVLLLELRSNRRFYSAESYSSFKDYNNVVMQILKEGKQEGTLHQEVILPLFRNLIFGTLEHVMYSWILFNRTRTPVDQADEICEILLRLSKPEHFENIESEEQNSLPEWTFNKKETILRVATSLFAENGFDKTRISDIASSLNIGEASIYEYFKNKEDILFNIPLEKTEKLLRLVSANFDKNQKGEMELRDFIRQFLFFLQTNRDYTAILLFELRTNRRFYQSKAYKPIKEFNDVLIGILKRGQEDGSFNKDINIYLVRHMIFGSIDHTVLTWLLFGKPTNLMIQAEHLIWLYLRALKN